MSAIDLNERLTDLNEEIARINEQMKTLAEKRSSALSQQDEETGKTARHQLQEFEEHLEDLKIMKVAVESKLRIFAKNTEKAAGIRKQISGQLWPTATKVLSKVEQAVKDVSSAIGELDQLNAAIFGLTAEHEQLIGESIPVPMISNLIPQDLRRVVGLRLPELPETLELKVHSQEVREGLERQEAILNERMSKQKTLILPYLESANLTWPKCKTCSRELVCMGGSVYAGGVQEIAGYGPEVREKAFRLQFHCEAGNHNGPQGFIRIEGGPYEKASLTRLEIER